MHKRILVTGGSGFVGTNLCLAIRERFPDIEVTALDSLHRRGSELNLPKLAAAGVRFEQGDVRVRSDLTAASLNPDLIIECSAEPSAQAGYGGSPEFLMETNLTGAYHCLELARLTKADMIFISTSRVYPYGKLNGLPFRETDTRYTFSQELPGLTAAGISEAFPLEGARSLYGTTKLAAELLVEEYADAYGFSFIIDRFGLLTGPGQMAKSDQGVIALWVAAHAYQRKLGYIGFGGTGKQVRDFLHIRDFCSLLLDQIEHFDAYKGQRFNAGGGMANSLSLLETTKLCQEITGKQIPMGSVPENRPADVRIYITDHSRVSSVRGWKPECDAHRTLSDIYKWLVDGGDALRRTMFPS
ncbi:MAG TPA: NAD-dependent epimerase/dehydratase family protein [Bryobacteraceae bacterium]|jgi:CDP-paratose 2-epimerase|nr:NAD-dependent epimerase/dehydratase family protein [Bryobacteraceae bacterium]